MYKMTQSIVCLWEHHCSAARISDSCLTGNRFESHHQCSGVSLNKTLYPNANYLLNPGSHPDISEKLLTRM